MAKRENGRRMSFSSTGIALGNMPDEVGMTDPTIHVMMSFEDMQQCPQENDLIGIAEKILQFDRFSGIPTQDTSSQKQWYVRPCLPLVDVRQMIRIVQESCDSINEVAVIVQEQRHYKLRDPNRDLPWWELVLIRNVGTSESMLLLRVDHALGDGLSIAKVCAQFITNHRGEPIQDFIPQKMRLAKAVYRFKTFLSSVSALFRIALLPFAFIDSYTKFTEISIGPGTKVSQNTQMIVFNDVSLDLIKQIKEEADVSLNDVLLTVFSQAIHDYCKHQKCSMLEQCGAKTRCRALMMVGFLNKSKDKEDCIRNQMSPLSIHLYIGGNNTPIEKRLMMIHKQTSHLKASPLAHFQLFLINNVLPLLPISLFRWMAYRISSRHSITYTSIPGPENEVFVGEKRVSSCRCSVVGHLHPIVSMVSYKGNISTTLVADSSIPDLEQMPMFFENAIISMATTLSIPL